VIRALTLLVLGASLFAADQAPPAGSTWKLRSEKVLEGNAPTVAPGKFWTIRPMTTNSPKSRQSGPAVVAKLTVSADGRVLTQEAQGTDANGKMFRYVLTWDRQ
jgi:hypothetical protein